MRSILRIIYFGVLKASEAMVQIFSTETNIAPIFDILMKPRPSNLKVMAALIISEISRTLPICTLQIYDQFIHKLKSDFRGGEEYALILVGSFLRSEIE